MIRVHHLKCDELLTTQLLLPGYLFADATIRIFFHPKFLNAIDRKKRPPFLPYIDRKGKAVTRTIFVATTFLELPTKFYSSKNKSKKPGHFLDLYFKQRYAHAVS